MPGELARAHLAEEALHPAVLGLDDPAGHLLGDNVGPQLLGQDEGGQQQGGQQGQQGPHHHWQPGWGGGDF